MRPHGRRRQRRMPSTAGMTLNRVPVETMASALDRCCGIQSQVAIYLGVSVDTVQRYVRRFTICREASDRGRDRLVDLALAKLVEKLHEGDLTAVIFTLRTLGKDDGWSLAEPRKRPVARATPPQPVDRAPARRATAPTADADDSLRQLLLAAVNSDRSRITSRQDETSRHVG